MVRVLLFLLILVSLTQARVLRDLPYAGPESRALQKLDLFISDEEFQGARPIVMLIHGGGWVAGDKSNENFAEPKTSWLMEQGYLVASVNYRLAPAAKHPAQVEDVCLAITWMQKHAQRYGGDPARIWLLGHSAGAQLAALAAVDAERQKAAAVDASALRGVILLDGAGYDIPVQYATLRKRGMMDNIYRKAFTDDPEIQRNASPVHRVTVPKPPPFLILHLEQRPGSSAQAKLLAAALQAKEGKAKVLAIEGKNHGTISADCGKPGDPVTAALAAFLRP
jgi:arylformamidase